MFWLRTYRENGEEGLKSQIGKKRGKGKGRPQGTFKLRTTIEESEKENHKLKIEVDRLKKGYLKKGVGEKRNSFL